MRTIVTGYAGFIGSNLMRMLIDRCQPGDVVMGLDCHTYAARPQWVWSHLNEEDPRFIECNVDIRMPYELQAVIQNFKPDRVYHLAAESHVCRSIEGPVDFATTNFMGTFNLLEALRRTGFKGRMVHVSTDEAFGELDHGAPAFDHDTPIRPTSPYSASKAASDLMVSAYIKTYGLDSVITRCTNNFGPNQHPEKLIPKAITSILESRPMTLYGDGTHSRDWIFVDDHCRALIAAMENGARGAMYLVGSGYECTNIGVVQRVYEAIREELKWEGDLKVEYTDGRPTDDTRYAVNNSLIKGVGWGVDPGPAYFRHRLRETVRWYAENQDA